MDKNSVAIVTGANSGMGKAITLELALTGVVVVMLCRSKSRGEEALDKEQKQQFTLQPPMK